MMRANCAHISIMMPAAGQTGCLCGGQNFLFCDFFRVSRTGNTGASHPAPPQSGHSRRGGGYQYPKGGFLMSKKMAIMDPAKKTR